MVITAQGSTNLFRPVTHAYYNPFYKTPMILSICLFSEFMDTYYL